MSREHAAVALRLLGWALVGALLVLGLGAAFTPLVVLALPAMGLAALLVTSDGLDRRTWAVLSGAAWLPLRVAWTDRAGGGEVCSVTGLESTCTSTGSPWLWLVAGLALLLVGASLSLRRPRSPAGQKA